MVLSTARKPVGGVGRVDEGGVTRVGGVIFSLLGDGGWSAGWQEV